MDFYQQIYLALKAVNAELMAEEMAVSTDMLYESLADRGLIQDGQLAYVTESGEVGYGTILESDDEDQGVSLTEEDLDLYLDAIVQTAMSEYETEDEEEMAKALFAFLEELFESGAIDPFSEDPDSEDDAKWVMSAKAYSLADKFLDWLDDGEED